MLLRVAGQLSTAAASSEGPAKDLPEKGGGRGFSMALAGRCQESQPAGGKVLGELAGFRREMFRCLWRRPDALFELTDAVLTAGNGAVAAVFKPGAGVPPRPRHGLPVAGRGPGSMRTRCGTCWWPGGRGTGRWSSRSMLPPIRGRGRRPARGGSGTITPARAITARTGRRWPAGRSSGWPSCPLRPIPGQPRRTRCGPAPGTTRPGRPPGRSWHIRRGCARTARGGSRCTCTTRGMTRRR